MLRGEVRKTRAITEPKPLATGPNPREIQAHIRAGLSAEEVAELLGCDIERIRPFEGPVLAEREHIVDRALAMPVLRGVQVGLEENPTFGTVIREKLADLSAVSERWTSWKAEDGWLIKLTFEAAGVERDARWTYDPRRSALAPVNDDATQLSRQGKVQDGLIPRLRALDTVEGQKDASTFDERSFAEDAPPEQTEPEPVADTADLLEALRRKRGQREAVPSAEETEEPPSRPVALLSPATDEAGDDGLEPEPAEETDADASSSANDASRRRRRPSMPSWDEIVFGARGDDQT
jgi:hypothetical protein